MMRRLSRRVRDWRLAVLVLSAPALLSCAGSQEPESESGSESAPPLEPPQDELPAELAGGQSGSEGGGEATPCFDENVAVVAGVVTELGDGCATLGDVEVLVGAGVLTSEDEGAPLRGSYRLHYTPEPILVGQTVYAIYRPPPLGDGTGSFDLALVEDGVVLLAWRGIFYESSFEELTSDGCKDSFLERPSGETLPDPEEVVPTPLSCDEIQ